MMDWHTYRDSGARLREALPYYRALGFFAAEKHRSDTDLAASVQAYHGADWDDVVLEAEDMATADQWLLMPDTSRVWFRDLEGVYQGENAYALSLQEWASISRGAFTPTEIAETWESDQGPVNVSFSFGGPQHTFVHPNGHDDFIDLRIVRMINQLLTHTPYRLEASDNLVDCRFIVALASEEKRRLLSERGWSFCDFLSA